jgi:hypothetical protein
MTHHMSVKKSTEFVFYMTILGESKSIVFLQQSYEAMDNFGWCTTLSKKSSDQKRQTRFYCPLEAADELKRWICFVQKNHPFKIIEQGEATKEDVHAYLKLG